MGDFHSTFRPEFEFFLSVLPPKAAGGADQYLGTPYTCSALTSSDRPSMTDIGICFADLPGGLRSDGRRRGLPPRVRSIRRAEQPSRMEKAAATS